jgi:uncharacterized membrane protein
MGTVAAYLVGVLVLLVSHVAAGAPCPYTIAELAFPGAAETSAWGISHAGKIVGEYVDQSGRSHGFVYDETAPSPFLTLDHPNSFGSFAQDINDSDMIIGEYCDTSGCRSYWYDGSFHDIAFPGAISTDAQGLNDAGLVVGDYEAPDFTSHVFTYDIPTDTYSSPGSFDCDAASFNGGDGLSASAIAGDVAFFSEIEHEYTTELSNPTACVTWDFPGASSTGGEGINDEGLSVGCYLDGSGSERGYIHDGSFSCTLEPAGAVVTCAEDVNNAGVVVGSYTDSGGAARSFVAKPIHQVPALGLPGTVMLAVFLAFVGQLGLGRSRGQS